MSILRRFLRDSGIYALSAVMSRGVAIVLVPLYTRFLQPAEYGALDLLTVFATVANYLVALEISQGLARVYSDAGTSERRRAYVSSAMWFAVAAYALFIAVALPNSAAIAGLLLDSRGWHHAVQAMILAVGANGVFFLLQDLLRWQLQPLRHAAASITYTAVSTAVGIYLVVYASGGVSGILYGQVAGAAAGIAAAWAGGAAAEWAVAFGRERWLEMLKYSAPQVISSVAAYFSLYMDRLLIKELMTLDDVGVYGVGARVASVVALLMMGFQAGLIPIVFRHYSEPGAPDQMARVLRYFLALALPALLALSAFSSELVWIFTTPRYYGAAPVIPLLATAVLLASMFIFVPGIFIARRTGLVALINIGMVALNLSLSLVLIPRLGTVGAAAATLTASLAAFLAYVYCNRLFYPIPFDWGSILKGVLFAAGIAVAVATIPLAGWHPAAAIALKSAACIGGSLAVIVTLVGRDELARALTRATGGTAT